MVFATTSHQEIIDELRADLAIAECLAIEIKEQAATALEAKDKELAALRELLSNGEELRRQTKDVAERWKARAETAERRVAELEKELKEEEERGDEAVRYATDRSNACCRAERERDEARAALKACVPHAFQQLRAGNEQGED